MKLHKKEMVNKKLWVQFIRISSMLRDFHNRCFPPLPETTSKMKEEKLSLPEHANKNKSKEPSHDSANEIASSDSKWDFSNDCCFGCGMAKLLKCGNCITYRNRCGTKMWFSQVKNLFDAAISLLNNHILNPCL